MSQVTVAGFPVASGDVVFPLRGAWSATLEVVAESAAEVLGVEPDPSITDVAGDVDLVVGSTTLRGYARAGVDRAERVTVRLVGGAGGLGVAVPPRDFVSQSRRVVLTDALDAGAERLSATSEELDATLSRVTRVAGTVGDAVRAVTAASGQSWRVLADGSVWVGTDTWPTVTPEHVLTREEPTQSRLILAVEGAVVTPGVTFLGRRITGATYTVGSGAIRAAVSYGEARDPLAQALGELMRRETAKLDYYASYTARVVGQNGDESLELLPGDSRLPGMSRVPIRPGLAGVVSMLVPVGSTALLAFENGDPARPYVSGFVGATATSVTLDASTLIRLGALATAFAARADLVMAELSSVATALATHTHAGVTPGPGVTGVAPPVYTPGSVAATLVQVE